MQSLDNGETSRWWRAMIWSLRIGVALQCLGNWWWLTRIGESPLLGWLINPADIGGLQWNESTAIATQRAIGWLALVAGVVVLLRPCAAVLGPLVLLQVTIATAMWRSADGFSLTADWLPAQWVTLFPFMTQAARIAAPAGLLLLDPWRPARPLREKRTRSAVTLLRWAAAVTFLAHGIESWQHNPQFTDLLIGATARVFGAELSQSTAEKLLSIIGAADMLVAIACVVIRSRYLMGWMVVWGAITASSRVVALGSSLGYMSLTRSPHVAVPLAVTLYWHLLQWRPADSEYDDSNEEDS